MGFLGQIEPKLQKLDLKSVFIDENNYTDPKNLKFRKKFLNSVCKSNQLQIGCVYNIGCFYKKKSLFFFKLFLIFDDK